MKFKVNKLTRASTKEEKTLEYTRRISFYHLMMTLERDLSKVFACTELERNAIDNDGEEVGCLKRPDLEPCQSCANAARHYVNYTVYRQRKATAMRQLSIVFLSENAEYDEHKEILESFD